ncbi:Serine/threonine-protein kinase Kist, partial [Rhizoclosmatium hyalinum]
NFYHGDVKCENILVSQVADLSSNTHTTSIRLADFGHARPIYNGIESYGTRAISPPEFMEDSPFAPEELDGRCSDVFALGMVMFSLLNDAGDSAPSIPCESMYEALEVYDGGRYPISGISDLDQEGWDLLNAMCRVDPFQRITVRQVLNHSWLQDIRI